MDSESVHYSLDLSASNGLTLSSEQRAALQTSLVILKRNYKFSRILFWGKILGLKCDYFIAQRVEEDEMKNRKSLYSLNCMDWHLLPPATESMIADMALAAQGRFTGHPSHEYEHTEMRIKGEGDDATEEEVMVKVNEVNRLATTVSNIDKDVSVVPRGAFTKSPGGKVQTNRSFGDATFLLATIGRLCTIGTTTGKHSQNLDILGNLEILARTSLGKRGRMVTLHLIAGLDPTEAAKLCNYLHFREPVNLKKKSILEMSHLNPAIDFLDPLSEDIPKGSWSLQLERGGTVCVLRSLLWLGLSFFHVPQTPQHGYIYMGDGIMNLDLTFML